MAIFLSMFFISILLGFAGAGGSGIMIGMLVALFHIPIHTALGTAVAAMIFTVLSGAYSHFREGNILLKSGLIVGLFGGGAAYGGSIVARWLPEQVLTWITAGLLLLAAILIWLRTGKKKMLLFTDQLLDSSMGLRFWATAFMVGSVSGFLSGIGGIGAAPFIQLGLLIFMGMSLRHTVGTTMIVILPIAVFGAWGYLLAGFIDARLLLEVLSGTILGSFIGAKFTKRVPARILRIVVVMLPAFGALLLIL